MALDHSDKNPLGGVGSTAANVAPITYGNNKKVRAPASYVWKLDDVSKADSGRTENTKMWKNRVGQVVGIELSWTNLPTEELHAILTAFNPEYLYVNYLDPQFGTATNQYYTTAEFYVGNRSAPLYNSKLNVWENVSFNIIKRDGRA